MLRFAGNSRLLKGSAISLDEEAWIWSSDNGGFLSQRIEDTGRQLPHRNPYIAKYTDYPKNVS
jgi:hypothetical protein